ncbi:MAG: ABC transporter substrate-binding protein [Acidimicrobiia bacterium]|nr:ABC transporter substrate-binding protein [Acidimicrobiia bacterium]
MTTVTGAITFGGFLMRTRSSKRLIRSSVAALAAFSLVAAACGGSDDGESDSTEAPSETEAPADTAATDDSIVEDEAAEPDDIDGSSGDETADEADGATDVAEIEEVEENTDPVPGGVLKIGMEADADGLNPTSSSWAVSGYAIGNGVFDALVRYDEEGIAQPYLAESWTSSEDFKSWDIKLREGITFHDGTPLNAEAVKANFESQLAAPVVGLAVRPFYPTEGAVEVVDEYTVRFNLLDANAYWPGTLASQLGYVASPTWLAAAAEDATLNQEPVGTGPFKFVSRTQNSETRLEKNPDWWNGEPYVDAVEFQIVTDPADRVDLFLGGELNSMHTSDPQSILDLRDAEGVQNVIDDTREETFLLVNSANPPFDDIRAREALARSTPRTLINQLIALEVTRMADQRFTPESKWFNPDVVQLGDDPESARPLIDAYCADFPENCSDGKINMEYQFAGPSVVATRTADVYEQGWSDNFNVTRDELLQDDHISETVFGQYNVVGWRSHGAPDPWGDNVWMLCRTAGDPPGSNGGLALNFPRLCSDDRDGLLFQAMASTDEAERIALYQQAEALMNQDFVYIYMSHAMWDNAFEGNVRGMCDHVTPEGAVIACTSNGSHLYDQIWIADS